MGFRGRVVRSTLAEANQARDWRIYADLAQGLIKRARRLYAGDGFGVELEQTVYAFDSTTIDLDEVPLEPGAVYVMDRGYLDWQRLYRLHQEGAFFVMRAKDNLRFTRHASLPVDPESDVRSDHLGQLARAAAFEAFPAKLRKVRFWDAENGRRFIFLTNLRDVPAATVAALYRSRWQIELFFRWIKQNLRIRRFYGTSENAVRTQLWIAICVYVLIAILKKELKLPQRLHRILQVVSVTVFERVPLCQLLMEQVPGNENNKTLNLFTSND